MPTNHVISVLAARCKKIAYFCAFTIAVLGVIVLLGWALDIATLKGVLPGLATMKANTALCFLFLGASLFSACRVQESLQWRAVQLVLAGIVILLGVLTLAEYLFVVDLGIDQILLNAPSDSVSTAAPGRMAMATAAGFVFSGLALLLLDSQRGRVLSQVAALAGSLIGILAILGYSYNITALYGVRAYSSVALHTAIGFVIINIGVIFSRPQRCLMAVLTSSTTGGVMARRLLPLALTVPFLIGWLHILGTKQGLYSADFGIALVVMIYVMVFSALIWRTAEILRRSEHKRFEAEQAQHKQQAQLTGIIDSAMDAIITLDEDQIVQLFNPAAERMFRCTAKQMLGESIDRLIPDHLRQVHKQHMRRFAEEGVTNRSMSSQSELLALHFDGTEFPIEASISKIRIAEKQIFTVILRDVTERHKAEAELHSSEERFRSLVEQASDGIFVSDAQGCYIDVNSTGCVMLGYARQELLNLNIADIIDPADIARIGYEFKYFEGSEVVVREWHFRRKDGSFFLGEVRGRQLPDGRLLAILIDITERKRIEEELRIAATAFDAQVGIMVTDKLEKIVRVNRKFTEITGYTADEAIGKTPRLLKSGRHDANFYVAMWESIQNTGGWQGEIWDRRKSGEIYPKLMTITAVNSGDGEPKYFVSTQIDITERKAAEEEIKNMAFYDVLTRLPNRRLLMDRLNQALVSSARNGQMGALLFIDLDHFKKLNDTLGHDIGDLLLQQVALRLKLCIREGDTAARLGGDEFVVMLEELSSDAVAARDETEAIGEKILSVLNQTYQLATHEYHNTPSIGITMFSDKQPGAAELLKQADLALYQSKKVGRNRLHFFDTLI
ncbi:MAG: PAS domain S-box protein [Proteobacteria bacterium]|nr:PAS domain S-box protein [Pseudomonadota bacterium]